jgi:hypothetical protein
MSPRAGRHTRGSAPTLTALGNMLSEVSSRRTVSNTRWSLISETAMNTPLEPCMRYRITTGHLI